MGSNIDRRAPGATPRSSGAPKDQRDVDRDIRIFGRRDDFTGLRRVPLEVVAAAGIPKHVDDIFRSRPVAAMRSHMSDAVEPLDGDSRDRTSSAAGLHCEARLNEQTPPPPGTGQSLLAHWRGGACPVPRRDPTPASLPAQSRQHNTVP